MDEVVPYFVALSTLASSEVDHLRFVGLLPPRKPATSTSTDASSFPDVRGDDEVSSSSDDTEDTEDDTYAVRLLRRAHVTYLHGALSTPLSRGYVSLDASHPWMVYWCLHSLDILGYFHNDRSSNDNYESNDESNDESGAKKTASNQNYNSSSSMLLLEEKHNLLLRVVSTLQYCRTDVDVSLDNM